MVQMQLQASHVAIPLLSCMVSVFAQSKYYRPIPGPQVLDDPDIPLMTFRSQAEYDLVMGHTPPRKITYKEKLEELRKKFGEDSLVFKDLRKKIDQMKSQGQGVIEGIEEFIELDGTEGNKNALLTQAARIFKGKDTHEYAAFEQDVERRVKEINEEKNKIYYGPQTQAEAREAKIKAKKAAEKAENAKQTDKDEKLKTTEPKQPKETGVKTKTSKKDKIQPAEEKPKRLKFTEEEAHYKQNAIERDKVDIDSNEQDDIDYMADLLRVSDAYRETLEAAARVYKSKDQMNHFNNLVKVLANNYEKNSGKKLHEIYVKFTSDPIDDIKSTKWHSGLQNVATYDGRGSEKFKLSLERAREYENGLRGLLNKNVVEKAKTAGVKLPVEPLFDENGELILHNYDENDAEMTEVEKAERAAKLKRLKKYMENDVTRQLFAELENTEQPKLEL